MVSYSLPLCAGTQSGVENVYLTEEEIEVGGPGRVVERGCEGTQNEAGAQPGHVCLFTANRPGALEKLWKSAKFVQMEEPDAVVSTTSGTQGVRAVFATTGFLATGKGTIPAGGAYLVAAGPWAVRAK
jgi:hypothetical protein